jgi:hypothetical protein
VGFILARRLKVFENDDQTFPVLLKNVDADLCCSSYVNASSANWNVDIDTDKKRNMGIHCHWVCRVVDEHVPQLVHSSYEAQVDSLELNDVSVCSSAQSRLISVKNSIYNGWSLEWVDS